MKIIINLCFAVLLISGKSGYAQPQKAHDTVADARRPNVLFIVVDDMNKYSVLKDYPVLKTPAIDKLIAQSYNFENASCAAPVCMPSRTAFFSGLYPHNTGVYINSNNKSPNPWEKTFLKDIEILPENFKRNGYTTWAMGKTFHIEIGKEREERMFDNRPVAKGGYGPFGEEKYWYGPNNWSTIQPWEGPDSDFPDVRNVDAAIDFLEQKQDKPFFMYLGLWRPHTPYTAPKRFFDMYQDEEMTLPPGYTENDMDDIPFMGRNLVDSLNRFSKEGLTKKQIWLKLMKAYCANTSFADWNIGRIMEALDKNGHAGNTIVVFSSDNGFHNGTKHRWEKATLWEQADAVPLLIRLPNGRAYKCPQTVSLIDIYPTLVEYCRLDPPEHKLDGVSLVPVLNNPHYKWDRPGFTTYGEQYASVRDERYRYIRYPDGSQELYDHQTDPYENNNVVHKPEMKPVISRLSGAIPKNFKKSIGGRYEVVRKQNL
ncbi:sulfatase [Botryobacter ruber]|uniref:sulfatase n=1 Tax=Botryobacter ruber TaxID=2171629 RepID=UPI0013E2EF09|nr:sulfatase [Botryobacter ruber]